MEDRIKLMMTKLDITYEEAKELIVADTEIDRMTSMKDINSDLTDEQKEASKKARRGSATATKKSSKREKKADDVKKSIIDKIITALGSSIKDLEIINEEREFTFTVNERKFKIVLSAPRK